MSLHSRRVPVVDEQFSGLALIVFIPCHIIIIHDSKTIRISRISISMDVVRESRQWIGNIDRISSIDRWW